MYVIYKALNFRRAHQGLFMAGIISPVKARGPGDKHVVAFARHHEGGWVVAAAARFFTGLVAGGDGSFKKGAWEKTSLALPADAPGQYVNVFNGETLACRQDRRKKALSPRPPLSGLAGGPAVGAD